MTQFNSSKGPSLGQSLQELMNSVVNLARSELKLMRAEVKETIKEAGRDSMWVALYASFALLGIIPFMAFLVIGLGMLLNNNYWLSALLVSLAFSLIGATLAIRMTRKIKNQTFSLPHTRESLQQEADLIRNRIQPSYQAKPNTDQTTATWRKVS